LNENTSFVNEEMSGACSTNGKEEKRLCGFCERERDRLEDLAVVGRMILKLT